jgi:hypothetical protein
MKPWKTFYYPSQFPLARLCAWTDDSSVLLAATQLPIEIARGARLRIPCHWAAELSKETKAASRNQLREWLIVNRDGYLGTWAWLWLSMMRVTRRVRRRHSDGKRRTLERSFGPCIKHTPLVYSLTYCSESPVLSQDLDVVGRRANLLSALGPSRVSSNHRELHAT